MKLIPALLLILLAVGLSACGGPGSEVTPDDPVGGHTAGPVGGDTAGPVVVASALPSAGSTGKAPTATATAQPAASATATPAPTTIPPSPIPPSATAEATSSPAPASPAPQASPASTPTPSPQPSPAAPTMPEAVPELANLRLELQPIAGGLQIPVGLAHADDGSGRLFIVEKAGRIRVLQDGALLPEPLLDISDRVGSDQSEQGLLGLAFHPAFAGNGLFFVNYTDRQGDTVISRFSMAPGWAPGGPPLADPGSEMPLLKLEQPAGNHNGGHLAFGPDGYLYIGTGDGGASNDKFGNGQNGATLLGAMLRLDVDGGEPYAIPPGNPFADDADIRDEIWALGLRNPWRYSFDQLIGDLYIADVGQNQFEEVNVQPAGSPGGQNYGWPIMEASHCFPADRQCDEAGLTLPLLEYDHSQGCSITGGYVYRGQEFPSFQGTYVFGDFCSGKVWGLPAGAGGELAAVELAQAHLQLSTFGEDESGELYLLDMGTGELFKLAVHSR